MNAIKINKHGSEAPLFTLIRGDRNSRTAVFEVSRRNGEADLSGLAFQLLICNAAGKTDVAFLPARVQGDWLLFSWVCGPVAAETAGITHVQLQGTDGEGRVQWSSGRYAIEVTDCMEARPAPEETAQLSQLQELMVYVSENLGELENARQTAALALQAAEQAVPAGQAAEAAAGQAAADAARCSDHAAAAGQDAQRAETAAAAAAKEGAAAEGNAAKAQNAAALAVQTLADRAPAICLQTSGEVITIQNGGAGLPLKQLKTVITPQTSGAGLTRLGLTLCGRNLLPGGTFRFTKSKRIYFDTPLPPGTYTLTASVESTDTDDNRRRVFLNGSDQGIFTFTEAGRMTKTVTYAAPVTNILFCASATVSKSDGDSCTWTDVQLEWGGSTGEYAPYTGTSWSVALPEETDGGEYDWLSGILTRSDGTQVQLESVLPVTLRGENCIWSNGGSSAAVYGADTKMYVDEQLAALAQALIQQ